jgi:hypothetical protein
MLKRIGVKEEEHNLRNKVARGKFTVAFFLQCETYNYDREAKPVKTGA